MPAEPTAMTVLGPVAAADLGITLPHEHILCDITCLCPEPADEEARAFAERSIDIDMLGAIRRDPLANRQNCLLDDLDLAIEELRAFGELGGRTVVELTLRDCARDPAGLVRAAEVTGLNIICGCGHYLHFIHPADVADKSEEWIADRMIEELTEGIGETGIRPGIIGEIGTVDPIHPREEVMLRAAVLAQRATGRTITVHTNLGSRNGLEVLGILERAGADLGRVVMGHVDFAFGHLDVTFEEALAYHLAIAERGCFVEYDTVGADTYFRAIGDAPAFWCASDKERAAGVARLFEAGHGDQVLISHDICLKHHLKRYGGFGYGHILREFQTNLKDAGLDQSDIDHILIDNPRRMLAG